MSEVTLGGDRLGSGKKQKVYLHGFERSTHDLSYIWRSTMAAGTLVPFLNEVALPGDTFDIDLNCDIKTHPTIGPLFGSFKCQLDIFQVPIRLYHSALHNNALGIGMNMKTVKLPKWWFLIRYADPLTTKDIDNFQTDPSSLAAYLGVRGGGLCQQAEDALHYRGINAVPLLAYWEIYKQYYSNKMEGNGYVIRKQLTADWSGVTSVEVIFINEVGNEITQAIPQSPATTNSVVMKGKLFVESTIANDPEDIVITFWDGSQRSMSELCGGNVIHNFVSPSNTWEIIGIIQPQYQLSNPKNWNYPEEGTFIKRAPVLEQFPLSNIDLMRQYILASPPNVEWGLNDNGGFLPYNAVFELQQPSTFTYFGSQFTQQGLGVKTYQSDLFNNWLNTDWIDGPTGINEITKVDTSGGGFNIDTLNLAKKVYDMLNRIAVSGGSYDDWLNAVYDHQQYGKAESPVYCGGLSKELVFQEVVSNASEAGEPLGTLAGKGVMSNKHKGGKVVVKVDEPSYIMGIISLTPRLDYSQGNKWDVTLDTLDDLHKPNLDQLGFQDLIAENFAWWTTHKELGVDNSFIKQSPGKQPAWINYMTNVNVLRGNFAIAENEMFMTLNRRYEAEFDQGTDLPRVADMTTYIDPSKYNHIFAQTSMDAQNFWVQVSVDMYARRKMSAKVMPNL